MTFSFLILTRNRESELFVCLRSVINSILSYPFDDSFELLILNNGGDVELVKIIYDLYKRIIESLDKEIEKKVELRVLYSGSNMGVAEGRNILFRNSHSDVQIFIDDDAEIMNPESFLCIVKRLYEQDEKIAIIAVQSIDKNANIIRKEIPRGPNPEKRYFACSFVGVCHIIFTKYIGQESYLYPHHLFYGMEEFYLSYKIINRGYHILYSPELRVRHYKSSKLRMRDEVYFINLASNKIYISYLLQNNLLFFSHLFFWTIWAVYKTKRIRCIIMLYKRLSRLISETRNEYYIHLCRIFFAYFRKNRGILFY